MPKSGLIILLTCSVVGGASGQDPTGSRGVPGDPARMSAVHLLNRITFGPRPGDVERVMEMGTDAFLDEQLTADRRPDPSLDAVLARFPVQSISSAELGRLVTAVQRERRAEQARRPDTALAGRPAKDRAPSEAQQTLRRHLTDLRQVALLRAIRANAQLYEITVDFWTNHFNVFTGKGPVRFLIKDYIEQAIRPHAFGRFEDLLIATAKSPAMLAYLDNAGSVAPGVEPPEVGRVRERLARAEEIARRGNRTGEVGQRVRQARARLENLQRRLPQGINENYARELLELHTLGVDGGYDQRDVEEVARVFTGWSFVGPPRRTFEFVFNAWAHDQGTKHVLGTTYSGDGMAEGLALLRDLAHRPATMTHISRKLCERFVSEPASDGCVASGVQAWQTYDGEIREVLRAILTSEDFRSPEHYQAKVKTPLEFLVSAVRALGGRPDSAMALVGMARRLGQPLFEAEAPTGYPESREEWVNSGALLSRMTVSLALASNRRIARPDLDVLVPLNDDVWAMVDAANRQILAGEGSASTLSILRERAGQVPALRPRRTLIIGLALGSPEFQRQ